MLNPIPSIKYYAEAMFDKARLFALSAKANNSQAAAKVDPVNTTSTQASHPVKGFSPVDTMAPASKDMIESKIDATSRAIDFELKKEKRDFEKLQTLVYDIIMLVMRRAVKTDHDYITEIGNGIKKQSVQIKDTYNTWSHLSVTLVSSGISVFGGFAGISRFLPASIITPENAMTLSGSALSIGNAGTGLNGVGSTLGSNSESKRNVYQLNLKRDESKEEERKGAKHSNNDAKKAAKAAKDEFDRMRHETAKSMASAA